MEEANLKEKLNQALEALPENQRITFLLHRIDGKKYAEIADMEGVSVKAIEKRMHLALKSLRGENRRHLKVGFFRNKLLLRD